MSISKRQSSLLVAEDWKRIYETFREADFQSYDFETLRKTMIDYLRLYYPEDFNDFIESSEYIALIDLIAFMGQSLAFRADMNARENFLDTAERRDSILKLARLVNYSPKRSISSTGMLKIESLTTTEELVDSNGTLLKNIAVGWNDSVNTNWMEQFYTILNSTLINSQLVGKPGNTQLLNGVETSEYSINIPPNRLAVYPFNSSISGTSTNFEVVSATTVGQPFIYEVDPAPNGKFNILHRNDNQGNSSNGTGYFMYFKQGMLTSADFNLAEGIPNRVINVGYDSINNTDVWLYDVRADGSINNKWKSIPAVAGINVIYNKMQQRNLYQINTRENDQIDLVFGDGSFANIPQGVFRTYFRVSNGASYKITPSEMQGVTISINYVSREGNIETLTIRANLTYTVANSAVRESIDEIRQKAPQQYYTQGRMITGEDYNIVPYTAFSDVLKVKSVNRTSSGISRYLNVSDTSSKYSSTSIFAQDGRLYKEETVKKVNFSFVSTANVQKVIQDDLISITKSKDLLHYYFDKFPTFAPAKTEWNLATITTGGCTGYFKNADPSSSTFGLVSQLGYVTSANTRFIRAGAIIKFVAPAGKHFNARNLMVDDATVPPALEDKTTIYAAVMQVIGDGTNSGEGKFIDGSGPVILSGSVPHGALIEAIIPVFKNNLPFDTVNNIAAKVINYNNFGLRYDNLSETWQFVAAADLDLTSDFSAEVGAGDKTSRQKDASWLIRFEYSNTLGYTIYHRSITYLFESKAETSFYFDNNVKVYDSATGTTISDQINVLKVNSKPDSSDSLGTDYKWLIYDSVVEADGFRNPQKVLVTFTDTNYDGIPDNPELFKYIVNLVANPTPEDRVSKLVFFKYVAESTSFLTLLPISRDVIDTQYALYTQIQDAQNAYSDPSRVFYAYAEDKFYILSTVDDRRVLTETTSYVAKVGRDNIYFHYRHNSPGNRRIDPTPINLIDVYVLTKAYEADYTSWIHDVTNTVAQPPEPTTEELSLSYSKLENFKAISDTIIFNSAKFKPLFGDIAPPELQATFKVVKNPALNISDNDIKSSVINAINTFFAVDNWDFGETFYFSELSAYLHTVLSPNVSSVIIVPVNPNSAFGSLYQINAEANEIVTSAATVNDVEIISSITAASINSNTGNILRTGTA